MGIMQRNKGKAFERKIASLFRERWPDAVVRRASQADRAHQSDVYVTGGPPILSRLWLECQDASQPTPLAKLEQAEFDVDWHKDHEPKFHDNLRLPVVVWHQLGSRTINVTMRLWVLDYARMNTPAHIHPGWVSVTMTLNDFLDEVSETIRQRSEMAGKEAV